MRVQSDVEAKRLFLPGLNLHARQWADDVANQRVHGTHGEVVLKRYLQEEPCLGKLYQVALRHALGDVEVAENLEREVTLVSWDEPMVETRDLRVYEEVASGAHAG